MKSSRLSWGLVSAARILPLVLSLAAAGFSAAHAQTSEAAKPESTGNYIPHADFQNATITGSNGTISVSRVPTVDANDVIHYWDVSLLFDIDASGNLTLASTSPTIALSPNVLTSSFRQGTYVGPSNVNLGKSLITVAGPGVLPSGATEWTLATASGASPNTYPATATWYVGSLTSSPIYARLKAAGITNASYYYGTSGSSSAAALASWPANGLLGFSQIGNTLTIYSFTTASCCRLVDQATPADQITYTLK